MSASASSVGPAAGGERGEKRVSTAALSTANSGSSGNNSEAANFESYLFEFPTMSTTSNSATSRSGSSSNLLGSASGGGSGSGGGGLLFPFTSSASSSTANNTVTTATTGFTFGNSSNTNISFVFGSGSNSGNNSATTSPTVGSTFSNPSGTGGYFDGQGRNATALGGVGTRTFSFGSSSSAGATNTTTSSFGNYSTLAAFSSRLSASGNRQSSDNFDSLSDTSIVLRSPNPIEVGKPTKQSTLIFKKLSKEPNAVTVSPETDKKIAAVAGREIFAILEIGNPDEENPVKEVYNFRGTDHLSSTDVKWCPNYANKHVIVTAAKSGPIVVWDLNTKKQTHVLTEHQRAVNHLCFQPNESAVLLLSASQDATVKLWDLRDKNNESTATYNEGKSKDGARNVKFNPIDSYKFAVSFENGIVQLFDIRYPSKFEKSISSHWGPVFAVDWHPEGRYLLSGGRDKMIRVWDTMSECRKPEYSITTAASVCDAEWRPGYPTQIASCSNFVGDIRIHVWDLARSHVPRYTFDTESGVNAILWKSKEEIWSVCKDFKFVSQTVECDSYSQYKSFTPFASTWNASGEITMVNSLDARRDFYEAKLSTPSPQISKSKSNKQRGIPALLVPTYQPRQETHVVQTNLFDAKTFTALANEYLLDGDSIPNICKYNAEVAAKYPDPLGASHTWLMIHELFSDVEREISSNAMEPFDPFLLDEASMDEEKILSRLFSGGYSDPNLSPKKSSRGSSFSSARNLPMTWNLGNWDYLHIIREAIDFFAAQGDVQICVTLFLVLQSKEEGEGGEGGMSDTNIPPPSDNLMKLIQEEQKEMGLANPSNKENVLSNSLGSESNRNKTHPLNIEENNVKLWLHSYIDLLHRFKLYVTATKVIKLCRNLPDIQQLNQLSTTIDIQCSNCNKSLKEQKNAVRCESCRTPQAICAFW